MVTCSKISPDRTRPTLPLPEGDRIVHLRKWDVEASDPEPRALHDFVVWREAMRSVSDLGAWEDVTRNLTGVTATPWFEMVGVVKDLGMVGAEEITRGLGLYLPRAPGSATPQMMIHTRGDPMALVPRVRAIAGAVDPTLRLSEFQRMDQIASDFLWIYGMWLRITLVMTAVALLLSLAGIYAVLSFAVARRTREIGVRTALGAPRRRVLTAIFRRPLTQVGLGIASGAVLIAILRMVAARTTQFESWPDGLTAGQVALLAAYAALCACSPASSPRGARSGWSR